MSLKSLPLGQLIASAPKNLAGERADLPVLSMTMKHGLIDQSTKFKKRIASEDVSNYKVVRRGQLVVGFPIDEGVLAVQNLYDEALVSPAYGVWDIHTDLVTDRFLVSFLKSQQSISYYLAKLRGSTARRRSLPTSVFLDLMVPLPQLQEQVRIIRILDEADELRINRTKSLALLDELAASLFDDMFSESHEWDVVSLGKATTKIGSGSTPRGGKNAYAGGATALIRSMNVHNNRFVEKDLAFISDEMANSLNGVKVQSGDVLLNITGASVARVCLVPDTYLPARVNQHVCIIRPDETLNSVFLARQLDSRNMKHKLLSIGGAGSTREAITKAELISLEVLRPPLKLQEEFALKIFEIERLKSRAIHAAELEKALHTSLQAQAFKGEL